MKRRGNLMQKDRKKNKMMMNYAEERFTIEVTEKGVTISDATGNGLTLAPVEALMLLDILKSEEEHLRELADAQSPLPMRFSFSAP